MPKSSHTQSPPHSSPSARHTSNAQRSPEDKVDKMTEVALRKKKNADAQAAFRARRANYIATLEETVTSLEAVVVQLQDSCRESRSEASELRQENARLTSTVESLTHEFKERERYLRALWHARKASDDPHLDDFPPPPPAFAALLHAQQNQQGTSSSSVNTPATTPQHTQTNPYAQNGAAMDPRMQYQTQESPVSMQSNAYHEGAGSAYGERSPSLPFVNHDGEAMAANGRGHMMDPTRQYSVFNMHGQVRDTGWHQGANQAGPSGPESVTAENGSASHTPAFIPSPTVTSNDISYGPRYTMIDTTHKTVLPGIDTVPYIMNNGDRSISPTLSSPHTTSSTSVGPHFQQFVFPAESQERNDSDYGHRMVPAPELTLHGGTADVSTYDMNRRRVNPGPDRPMLGGGMSTFRATQEAPAPAAETSRTSGDSSSPNRRARRNTAPSTAASTHSSRSPSPTGHAPISSTLAVIKAQAFGALRRTRARPKRGSEGAAKMAMEVLEARGIGLGIGSSGSNKRPRLLEDEGLS